MFSRRAAAATKSSIKALSKVCYRNKFPNSIKVAPLGRRFSTATEASPYYQTPVSNDPNEQLSDCGAGGSDKSLNSVQYNQNSRNDFNRNARNWETNSSFSGNESFGAAERYAQNGGGCSGGVSQSCDQNSGHNLQNFSRANSPAAGDYHQKWDGYKWSKYADGHHQNFQARSENLNGPNGVYHQGRDAGYNGGHSHYGSAGQFSRNLGGSRGGNAGVYHQDGSNVPSHQMGGVGQRKPSDNNGSMSNYGQFQRVENNYHPPSTGTYQHQQNGNVRSQTANYYNYPGHNVAEYQQNPYGNLIHNESPDPGPLQHNSNTPYPSTSSQAPSYSNTDGASPDGVETQQIRGTVEELEQFVTDGKVKEALEVLELLEKNERRLDPEGDVSTVVKLIEACGEGKDAKEAKIVHKALAKLMSPLTVSVYNKILDMYLKCGSVEDAYSLFNDFSKDDLMSWDTMIRGLAKNDLGEEAIDIFTEFKSTGLKPDGRIFIGVFVACGIVGDVIEGMLHFQSMSGRYGITPSMEHYVGVVEMLGHAGYLDNALEFVENMPVDPSVDVWETMMRVCRVQGNAELGDRCTEIVEKLDPSRLSEQSRAGLIPLKASDLEKEKEKKKLASQSLLEVRSRVHEYRAGDTSHPENDRIYALLRGLKTQMKEVGYTPELRGVLHDIDPEGKEEALLAHSERLAAAYGFLTTAARQPIRVIKNLRVCVDCHNALKIISKLVGRELIMRDAKRFHHFKDGVCSCKDYW